MRQFKGSVHFLSAILIIGHALSFLGGVYVKYHSHRIISNRKLPRAAVCVWHGDTYCTTKLQTGASVQAATVVAHCVLHSMHQHYNKIAALKSKQWRYLSLSPLLLYALSALAALSLSLFSPSLFHPTEFGPELRSKLQHTQLEREKGCKKTNKPLCSKKKSCSKQSWPWLRGKWIWLCSYLKQRLQKCVDAPVRQQEQHDYICTELSVDYI